MLWSLMGQRAHLHRGNEMIQAQNNRDPRWSPEVDAAIAMKVAESMAFAPRLEASQDGFTPVSSQEREVLLTVSYREIVKATSLDTLMAAPPGLLEQLSVLALVNNENIKGILVQVIRVYMLLWGTPETNALARQILVDMEEAVAVKLFDKEGPLRPECLQWRPRPV